MGESGRAPEVRSRWAAFVKLGLFLTVVIMLNVGGSWLARQIDFQIFPRHDLLMQAVVWGAALLYLMLMATPFMPGIEVGLALMLMLGGKGAILVYVCTVLALSISFAAGRMLPPRMLWRVLDWFHLHRAAELVRRLEPLDPRSRLRLLEDKSPSRIAPFLLRHRYLAIAALLNLPGNALIGGGGGIGLIVGMSRLIPFHGFIVLVACAVAPVPALFWLRGA